MTTKKGLRMTETCSVDGNVRINHGVCMTNQGMYDQSWAPGCTRLLAAGTSTLRMVEKSPSQPPFLRDSNNALPGLLDYRAGSPKCTWECPKRFPHVTTEKAETKIELFGGAPPNIVRIRPSNAVFSKEKMLVSHRARHGKRFARPWPS